MRVASVRPWPRAAGGLQGVASPRAHRNDLPGDGASGDLLLRLLLDCGRLGTVPGEGRQGIPEEAEEGKHGVPALRRRHG